MLKRSDLSKQFELVVQQEIKNFQDVSYQINQTLNELRSKIENLEKTTSNNHALLESRYKSLSIELEILKLDHDKTQRCLDSHVNDTSSNIKFIDNNITALGHYTINSQDKINQSLNEIKILRDGFNALEDQYKSQRASFNSDLERFELKIHDYLSKTKQEIRNMPSESEDLRKEFRERLACHKVDVEGITKEFKVNRKEFMVIEKKLESIFTLIDNLKKAGATS